MTTSANLAIITNIHERLVIPTISIREQVIEKLRKRRMSENAHDCRQWRTSLIQLTHDYWENGDARNATEQYIRNLLPEELAYAQKCENLDQHNGCHTLVLLLGFSPEPLLQSICVYQPHRIVLICNWTFEKKGEKDKSKS